MIRSGYSFKAAIGHLDEVAARLKHMGWEHAPLADRHSTFGFVRWKKVCEREGLRPVFGVELGVSHEPTAKKAPVDYWTFFAKDNIRALHHIIALATKAKALTYAEALSAEGVVKISGNRTLLEHVQPQDDFYMALMPSTPRGLYRAARNHKWIARSDNAYCNAADRELYRIALSTPVRSADTQSYPQHILTDEEWRSACMYGEEEHDAALANRNTVLAQCNAPLNRATLLVPQKEKSLLAMCEEGARKLNCNLQNTIYAERLQRELTMIEEKKFEDYFYIIAEVIAYAKQHMIVGPARGSSCGSLVCYLLGITAIDPIPHGLIFERFIDVNRSDLPDIDIDFSDERRDLVFKYIEERYGEEHVARLGTVGMFKPRSALKQAAMNLRVPQFRVERVLENVIVRSSGDTRANMQLEDTLRTTPEGKKLLDEAPEIIIAARLENHPHTASQHAAGIVITEGPIADYVAVDSRTKAAWCDKKDAETLNLLKIDALGLTQLSIFERTMELIGVKPVSGWLERLPMDDSAAYDVLNQGKFSGVFQFNGIALQNLTKSFTVDKFDDLVHITALARPGPLGSGAVGQYVKRRTGREPVAYPHPLFEPYLRDTYGVVMYQEQVMQIGRNVGDLTWSDVTALRQAMSKSMGKEYFDRYGDRWKAAAEAKGINRNLLDKVWDDLCAYGNWSFNKSHAVAYATVSYYCLWFKAHHPLEFAAATLDAEKEVLRQIQILRELHEEGVGFVPVDRDYSTDRWAVGMRNDSKTLVGPLTAIKGIGPAGVKEILTVRRKCAEAARANLVITEDMKEYNLKPGLKKKLDNAETELKSIFPVTDMVKTLDLETLNIKTTPCPVKKVDCGVSGRVLIIGVLRKMNLRDENEDINVAKRGYRITDGKTWSLNMFVRDDTDEIFVKVSRHIFEQIGREISDRGKIGKAVYAVAGSVPADFRMITAENVRYLGDLGVSHAPEGGGTSTAEGDNLGLNIPERPHDNGSDERQGGENSEADPVHAFTSHILPPRQKGMGRHRCEDRSDTGESAHLEGERLHVGVEG